MAIAALYLYVAPGLKRRLIDEKLNQLSRAALTYSRPISATVGSTRPERFVRELVNTAAARSSNRVSLMSVAIAVAPGGPQLTQEADSAGPSGEPLMFPVAHTAVARGRLSTGHRVDAVWAGGRGRIPRLLPGTGRAGDRVLGARVRRRAQRDDRPPRGARRRGDRAAARPDRREPRGPRAGRRGSSDSSVPPSRSHRASSSIRSASTRPTSSVSSRSRSTTCSASSPSSSRPARSSSRPPRTSCARRSSRSAGSSSCSRTTTSTPRRGGASSSRSEPRSIVCASCPSTCSTCPGSRPGRWSCGPNRSTSAS